MPLYREEDLPMVGIDTPQVDVQPMKDAASWSELFNSAMETDNSLYSLFTDAEERARLLEIEPVPGYEVSDEELQGYEDDAAEILRWGDSPGRVALVKKRIDRERQAQEMLGENGWSGFAMGIAAGVVDPVNLIPIGGSITKTARIGRDALNAAKAGAAAGVAGGLLAEGALQQTHVTRGLDEAIGSVAFGALFGGFLGGTAGVLSAPEAQSLSRAFSDDLRWAMSGERAPMSAGAAARDVRLSEDLEIDPAFGVEKLVGAPRNSLVGSPAMRLALSISSVARRAALMLVDPQMRITGNKRGVVGAVGGPVETRIKLWDGGLYQAIKAFDDSFVAYRLGRGRKVGDIAATAVADTYNAIRSRTGDKLSREQFSAEVAKAMRRNDEHVIPEVAAAAKAMREFVFDPLKKAAIELGRLPENVSVSTADSYLTRVYDIPKIINERGQFERILRDWLAAEREAAKVADPKVVENWTRMRDESKATIERLTKEKLIEAADEKVEAADEVIRAERQKIRVLEGQARVHDRRMKKLERTLAAARERLERFKPDDKLAPTDPLVQALNDARKMKEPKRIVEEIRAMGGVRDLDGTLKNLGFLPVQKRAGKILKTKTWEKEIIDPDAKAKDGRGIDQIARSLAEQGYIERRVGEDGAIEDVDLDVLTDALERDLGGEHVYAEFGDSADEAARWREAQALKKELSEADISLEWSNERIAYELGAVNDIGVNEKRAAFKPDTPVRRERVRQAGWYARKVGSDVEAEGALFSKVSSRLEDARAKRDQAELDGQAARREGFDLSRELSAARRTAAHYSSALDQHNSINGLGDEEMADIARQIVDNIVGLPSGHIYSPIPLQSNFMRERTLNIKDELIEDFLVNDIEQVSRIYMRSMAPDVEISRAFNGDDVELTNTIDDIKRDFARMREKVENSDLDEKARRKALDRITREQDSLLGTGQGNQGDLRDVLHRMRHMYKLPADPSGFWTRLGRAGRTWNYMRLGGGFVITSLVDVGHIVMTQRMSRLVGNYLLPSIRNWKLAKLSADEARLWGTANDIVLGTRANMFAELFDEHSRMTKFERGVQATGRKFGLVNALSLWTDFTKRMTAIVSQTRTLQAAEKLATTGLPEGEELARLSQLGIDRNLAFKITDQFRRYGKKEAGVYWANTAAWTDREAAEAFGAAMVAEVDRVIVTPGQDKPLWMSTEGGKVLGQFKSFTAVSLGRMLGSALQRRDAAVLEGMVTMTALGMLSAYLAAAVAGKTDKLPDDPKWWVAEGINRSGVLGWLMDANMMAERSMGVGALSALGVEQPTKYRALDLDNLVGGPMWSMAEDTVQTLRDFTQTGKNELGLTDEEAKGTTRATLRRFRRLIPLQNLFWLRWAFDMTEDAVGDAAGLPERKDQK